MKYRGVLCCLAVLAALQIVSGMTWELCEGQTGKANISEVTLKPDPPTPGANVEFSMKGSSDEEVAGGNLNILVNFMGVPIFTETRDLCARTKCPIGKGPLEISYTEYLPPIAPPGPYIIQLSATSSEEELLLCLNVSFEMLPPPMPPAAVEEAQKKAEKALDSLEKTAKLIQGSGLKFEHAASE